MFIGLDLGRLEQAAAAGGDAAGVLGARRDRLVAAADFSGVPDRGAFDRTQRSVDVISGAADDLRRRVGQARAMLESAGAQSWVLSQFGDDAMVFQAIAVLAGLLDRATLPNALADIVRRVADCSVDREWMERQDAPTRLRWLALFGLRWLPEVNAVGATNCLIGVVRAFDEIGAITANSFASVVDAQILCAFADGVAWALGSQPPTDAQRAARGWKRFFDHQRALPFGGWNAVSTRLWARAEQRATEIGYDWAVERKSDPTIELAVMALGSEVFRWINRQSGLPSDPIPELASNVELVVGYSPASVVAAHLANRSEAELRWLFDPRNQEFTYAGVMAIHAAADMSTSAPSAAELRALARDGRAVMSGVGRAIAANATARDAACTFVPVNLVGCR